MSKIAKKCLLALSAALLAVCIILPVAFSLAEESDGVKNLPGNLTSETVNELFVGTQLDFQESYIVKDGERLETSCEMTRPDGSVLATKKILLEEMGVYRIALFGFHSSGAYAEYVYVPHGKYHAEPYRKRRDKYGGEYKGDCFSYVLHLPLPRKCAR